MTSSLRRLSVYSIIAIASGLLFSSTALGDTFSTESQLGRGFGGEFHTNTAINGFLTSPSVITTGAGTLRLQVSSSTITYTLSYSNLSGAATAAHIHFSQPGVNGGPMAFLCGGGPTSKPACPSEGNNGGSGSISGTITAADVMTITGQENTAQDFSGLVSAIKNGSTYVNIHTANFPAGEIRGNIGN